MSLSAFETTARQQQGSTTEQCDCAGYAEIGAGRGRLDFSVVGDVDRAPLMAALGLEVRVQLARRVGRRRAYMHRSKL